MQQQQQPNGVWLISVNVDEADCSTGGAPDIKPTVAASACQ